MSEFVVQLKVPCTQKHTRTIGCADEVICCQKAYCPGFTYTEVDLATALKAVLRENPSLLREVRRDAVKPSEIL